MSLFRRVCYRVSLLTTVGLRIGSNSGVDSASHHSLWIIGRPLDSIQLLICHETGLSSDVCLSTFDTWYWITLAWAVYLFKSIVSWVVQLQVVWSLGEVLLDIWGQVGTFFLWAQFRITTNIASCKFVLVSHGLALLTVACGYRYGYFHDQHRSLSSLYLSYHDGGKCLGYYILGQKNAYASFSWVIQWMVCRCRVNNNWLTVLKWIEI